MNELVASRRPHPKVEYLEIGREYTCESDRRGTFRMRIIEIDDVWVTGIITVGIARAKIPANVRHPGGKVTVRASLTNFTPVPIGPG